MAPRNKENGSRSAQSKQQKARTYFQNDEESSEEDYRKKRDKNNQVCISASPPVDRSDRINVICYTNCLMTGCQEESRQKPHENARNDGKSTEIEN